MEKTVKAIIYHFQEIVSFYFLLTSNLFRNELEPEVLCLEPEVIKYTTFIPQRWRRRYS